ncbi:MAG TPA: maleylpyruvate isomerase N-terminal domain-containing protein [Acidimicrobiales bacterium]|nr:maleylpyruvate isomerase N-terminal domain-containing protein [Acidimicrobiales bacterium]
MPIDGELARSALVAQWRAVAAAVPAVDLDLPSRVDGWRNREVLAHLYVQPILLGRFLLTASGHRPVVDLTENLAATRSFAEMIDASAREGAEMGKFDLALPVEAVAPALSAADLGTTITTVQGPIPLVDYLVTRCVEAVVHGMDLVDPVEPEGVAEAIAADALMAVLASRDPRLVPEALALPPPVWIDVATGRQAAPEPLASAVPVMA